MRELNVDFFVSVDGFAADAAGTQDWIGSLAGPETGRWIQGVLAEPQVMLLGRKTYQLLSGYWPSARAPQAGPMNHLPKLVVSKTLSGPLAWSNSRLVAGDLATAVRALKDEPGPPLRTIGSLELVKSLTELGLVDRLRMLVFPAILGAGGRQRVLDGHGPRRLELAASRTLDGSVLWLDYRVARGSSA